MDVSDLNDTDLRILLGILQKDQPDALSAAIETMNSLEESPRDDITFNATGEEQDENLDLNANFGQLKLKKGCYLHYDSSSAKLKLQYTSTPVPNAIGFYSSPTIPDFKFKKNFGRADLIGNCASGVAGRKQYYSGWCQFIKAARAAISSEGKASDETTGEFWIFPRDQNSQGLDVDIYVYDALASYQTVQLPENEPLHELILNADAVTCLPRHSSVFEEVKKIDLNRWLVRAANIGSTSRFIADAGPGNSVPDPICLTTSNARISGGVVEESKDLGDIVAPPHEKEKGCYLLYDADSCKLKLQYSSSRVRDAIGFYSPGSGHTIRGFKFTKNFGRAELIGNCAAGVTGRKNYYSGWCQFIRAARAHNGHVWMYPRKEGQPGLDVDIFVYYKEPNDQEGLDGRCNIKLEVGVPCDISNIDGVACLPKHADFFLEVKTIDMNRWMTEGNTIGGATSRFE
jgi:endogenous inhibitor of DNA gyrase (YacG/DUF329 family)